MKLETMRKEIDQIDDALMTLFKQRMHVAKNIGALKRIAGLPIEDSAREARMMQMRQEAFADESLWPYFEKWFNMLVEISKEVQR